MNNRRLKFDTGFISEYLLAFTVFICLIYAIWQTWQLGHLPQPFFYMAHDTYMDWFNVAYWAHHKGAYDSWLTVYPPLSFVALRLMGLGRCYTDPAGTELRDCDWVGLVVIHVIFVLNLFLLARTYIKIDKKTALARSFALGSGMPMLYCVERGNLMLLCFTCVVLGFGPLLKSAKLRWLFVGLAINFKVYVVGILVAHLLRRRWMWFEGAIVATVLVYALSYGIYGAGSPLEIYANIVNFSSGYISQDLNDLWYSITYIPLISLLEGQAFPVTANIGSGPAEIGLLILPLLVKAGQLSIVLAAIAAWLRPEVVPIHRLSFLAATLALISSEVGGYALIIVIFFVFMERWKGIFRPFAIVLAYVICIPSDIIVGSLPTVVMESFLVGGPVEIHFGVGLGMFLRPGFLILIGIALSAETIYRVYLDIGRQGWRSRWRYRRDLPILPGVISPTNKNK
jgi:hypothetical protein